MAQQEYLHSKSYLVSAREGLVLPKAFKSAVEAIDFSRANNLVQRGYNIVMKGGDVIRTLKSGRIKEAPHMGETIGRGEDGRVPQTVSKAVSESTMREFRIELRKLPVWKLKEVYNNLKERKPTGIAILDKHRAGDFNLVLDAVNEALWERGRLPPGELKHLPQTEGVPEITPKEWQYAKGLWEVTKEDAERGEVAGVYLWSLLTKHYRDDKDKQIRLMGYMNELTKKYPQGRVPHSEAMTLAKKWDVQRALVSEILEFLPQVFKSKRLP